jgi:branched-chain amino acid transport system substrate-binding protein
MAIRGWSSALGLLLGLTLGACGGGGGDNTPSRTNAAVVYSSLPVRGARSAEAADVSNGIKLALEQAQGRAGKVRVRYRALDDSSGASGKVNPAAVARNARAAVRDDDAVAYIGELDEGSPHSIPFTNEGGVAQIGIADTAVGLTTDEAGANPAEPVVYRASGKRTFVRIVPRDTIQAAALVSIAIQNGCTSLAIANDGTRFGSGLEQGLEAAAKAQELGVAVQVTLDAGRANYRSEAKQARLEGADCFAFAGLPSRIATRAYVDFGAALAGAELFGPDRLNVASFTEPDAGGVPAALARRIQLTIVALSPNSTPATKLFIQEYERTYEEKPRPPARYGYEAMRLVLDAIGRSGDDRRADVIHALFDTRERASVLGSYSIDANGDTTLASYGIGSIVDGKVEIGATIHAPVAD